MNIALNCALPPHMAHVGDDWRERCQGYGSFYLFAENEKDYIEPALFLRTRCPNCLIFRTIAPPPFIDHHGAFAMEPIIVEGDETLAELAEIAGACAAGHSLRAIAKRVNGGGVPIKEIFGPYLKTFLSGEPIAAPNPVFDQWIARKQEEVMKRKFDERLPDLERRIEAAQFEIDHPSGPALPPEDAIATYNQMVAELAILEQEHTTLCRMDRFALLREALVEFLI